MEGENLFEHLKTLLQKIEESADNLGNTAAVSEASSKIADWPNKKDFLHCSQNFINFQYENPTTYHVIRTVSKLLKEKGFEYVSERDDWSELKPGKYITTRNSTNLAAFVVGPDWKPKYGIGAIATHCDSLTVKLKPSSLKDKVEGFDVLGVAPYGGTLNESWFDRDLGLGGKVLVKDEKTGKVKSVLIDSSPHPIAKIPSLAPHFGDPAKGPFDKEDQAVPIVGYVTPDEQAAVHASDDEKKSPLFGKHCLNLLRWIAKQADVKVSQLVQLDLELFDVQKGTFGGIKNDFIFAPRLDDRLCTFAALHALLCFVANKKENLKDFSLVCLFDNEEVGSLTRQGAKGGLLESVVERYATASCPKVDLKQVFANSIILSADVNHMFNPNFKEVYMHNHSPKPNVGITLSLDPNAHMATDVVGVAFAERLASLHNDKVQYFQIKNNSRSGGTIGPSLASQTGARTIDLGIAQLSMHSIRAATGSIDVGLGAHFFAGFLENWRKVYDEFDQVDECQCDEL